MVSRQVDCSQLSKLLSVQRLWQAMASEMGTMMDGKKATPPRRGMCAVCNFRSSNGSKSRRLKAISDILGIIIALSRQLTANAAKVSK